MKFGNESQQRVAEIGGDEATALKNSTLRTCYRWGTRRILLIRRRRHRLLAHLQCFFAGGRIKLDRKIALNIPLRIDGPGTVTLHRNVVIGSPVAPGFRAGEAFLQARNRDAFIEIGAGTATSNSVCICSCERVEIGKFCLIGDHVSIYDSDFHDIDPALRRTSAGQTSPVRIGNNVWLGSRVIILKGVEIGDNTVIAAGAVVSKSIPPNVLAGGVPARIIRQLPGTSESTSPTTISLPHAFS